MKIVIDIDSSGIETHINKYTLLIQEWLQKNGDSLGHVLAIFHFMLAAVLVTLVIVSHTIYRSVWLKLFLFIFIFIIWIQHILFNVCILTSWEKYLTNNISPFHIILQKVLGLVGLTMKEYNTYLIVIETVAVTCFSLELLSNTFDKLFGYV